MTCQSTAVQPTCHRFFNLSIQGYQSPRGLGWVDLDLGCSTVLLGQHQSCSTAQRPVEHPKSKSTQTRSARRWVTLYSSSAVIHPRGDAVCLPCERPRCRWCPWLCRRSACTPCARWPRGCLTRTLRAPFLSRSAKEDGTDCKHFSFS